MNKKFKYNGELPCIAFISHKNENSAGLVFRTYVLLSRYLGLSDDKITNMTKLMHKENILDKKYTIEEIKNITFNKDEDISCKTVNDAFDLKDLCLTCKNNPKYQNNDIHDERLLLSYLLTCNDKNLVKKIYRSRNKIFKSLLPITTVHPTNEFIHLHLNIFDHIVENGAVIPDVPFEDFYETFHLIRREYDENKYFMNVYKQIYENRYQVTEMQIKRILDKYLTFKNKKLIPPNLETDMKKQDISEPNESLSDNHADEKKQIIMKEIVSTDTIETSIIDMTLLKNTLLSIELYNMDTKDGFLLYLELQDSFMFVPFEDELSIIILKYYFQDAKSKTFITNNLFPLLYYLRKLGISPQNFVSLQIMGIMVDNETSTNQTANEADHSDNIFKRIYNYVAIYNDLSKKLTKLQKRVINNKHMFISVLSASYYINDVSTFQNEYLLFSPIQCNAVQFRYNEASKMNIKKGIKLIKSSYVSEKLDGSIYEKVIVNLNKKGAFSNFTTKVLNITNNNIILCTEEKHFYQLYTIINQLMISTYMETESGNPNIITEIIL